MDPQNKKAITKRQRAAAVMILAVTLLVTYAFIAFAITPAGYNIGAGDVSPATITASRDIVDTISTEEAVEKAKAEVSPVYAIDDSVTASTGQGISGFFDSIETATEYFKSEYINAAVTDGGEKESIEKNYDAAKIEWDKFITPEMKAHIRSLTGDINMPDSAIYSIAKMNLELVNSIKGNVLGITAISLDGGIIQQRLQAEKDGIKREITNLYSDPDQQYVAYLPIDKYLKANMLYDAAATNTAMNEAAQAVEPIRYKSNQTVVTEGEVVTPAQLGVLKELGVIGATEDKALYIGMFLFTASAFLLYTMYLLQFEGETVADTRKLVILCSIIIVTTAIAIPLTRLDSRIISAFFGGMLACVLVSRKSAIALSILLAFLAAPLCSWESGLISVVALRTLFIAVAGGLGSVFSLFKPGHRASLIYAGLVAGTAAAALAVVCDMTTASWTSVDAVLLDCVYAVGSGLFGGVLAIGTQPLWEAAFKVSTPAKLVELSDPNHPLLKRLVTEAPGTYYHSVLTANLAEAGADAVGANALLCRVGAYYHDIGKLKDPEFFKENQKNGNPHDTMDPRESAKIITQHLTYGAELAKKYKLPREVQKIITQHHGDTVVPYFFHRAKEAGLHTEDTVFRYKGTKPSTRESAVVMLADCVEAAVKSLDEQGLEHIKDMVSSIIRIKYNEGQLDDCPLGRREFNALAKAFTGVYEGAFHERIKYPNQELTDA